VVDPSTNVTTIGAFAVPADVTIDIPPNDKLISLYDYQIEVNSAAALP
jgi:hypothetical protein